MLAHHQEWLWDAFPYVNPETLEFAYCDAHYQYILCFTNVVSEYLRK